MRYEADWIRLPERWHDKTTAAARHGSLNEAYRWTSQGLFWHACLAGDRAAWAC